MHFKKRPGGSVLGPNLLGTVRLQEAKRKAIEIVATRWIVSPTGQLRPAVRPARGSDVEGFDHQQHKRTVTDDKCMEAYAVYQRMKESGRRDFTVAAAHELNLSRPTFSRYVQRAEGLLGLRGPNS